MSQISGWHIYKLYNGEVTIGFDEWGKRTGMRHTYWLKVPVSDLYPKGMKLVPGVTGISGLLTEAASGLSPWAAKCAVEYLRDAEGFTFTDEQAAGAVKAHTDKRDTAALRGTSVHKFVERIVSGETVPEADRKGKAEKEYKAAAAVVEFLERERIKVMGCETKIFSRRHEYCGTMDLDVLMPDGARAAIVDIKTSKAFRVAHAMQIAAYVDAREEEYPGTRYVDAGVLLAGNKPSLKWLGETMRMPGREALDRCFNAFLGLLAVRTSIPNINSFGYNPR